MLLPSSDYPSDICSVRDLIENFLADRETLRRALPPVFSPARAARERLLLTEWQERLEAAKLPRLDTGGRIDRLLFSERLSGSLRRLDAAERRRTALEPLVPGAVGVADRQAARRRMERSDARDAAAWLETLAGEAREAAVPPQISPPDALRVAEMVGAVRDTLQDWFAFYDGYDPLFSWWARVPFGEADAALCEYADRLREQGAGITPGQEEEAIIGAPIGRDALLAEIVQERLPYSPEELIAIGEQEAVWCEAELRRAAADMGLPGDDWKAALERVKADHVAPGEQSALVRDLALEAIALVEDEDLVTIPPLCREVWRLEMLSPEAQRTSPFFLGGEVCRISFPTDAMPHARKKMSLRGNNRHFARATVQHELIPGHHLQLFMADRHNTHRRLFHTPFYVEGWTLHWEMLLWERGFARTPEARVGMLFWRLHRCARIIFSLRFHLGEMSAGDCIAYLIERVGHEPDNAAAEVRRSVGEAYPPLYQAAYMLGGLQMHGLYHEMVGSGRMTPRAFHDAVLIQNAIPVEMVRAALTGEVPEAGTPGWRFYTPRPPAER